MLWRKWNRDFKRIEEQLTVQVKESEYKSTDVLALQNKVSELPIAIIATINKNADLTKKITYMQVQLQAFYTEELECSKERKKIIQSLQKIYLELSTLHGRQKHAENLEKKIEDLNTKEEVMMKKLQEIYEQSFCPHVMGQNEEEV